jgi:hypothetical protein
MEYRSVRGFVCAKRFATGYSRRRESELGHNKNRDGQKNMNNDAPELLVSDRAIPCSGAGFWKARFDSRDGRLARKSPAQERRSENLLASRSFDNCRTRILSGPLGP